MNLKRYISPLIAGFIAAILSAIIYGGVISSNNGISRIVGYSYWKWLAGQFLSGFVITLIANLIGGLFEKKKD